MCFPFLPLFSSQGDWKHLLPFSTKCHLLLCSIWKLWLVLTIFYRMKLGSLSTVRWCLNEMKCFFKKWLYNIIPSNSTLDDFREDIKSIGCIQQSHPICARTSSPFPLPTYPTLPKSAWEGWGSPRTDLEDGTRTTLLDANHCAVHIICIIIVDKDRKRECLLCPSIKARK